MESTPSFTFQKEHPGKRTLFGEIDPVLGFSIICALLAILLWIGSILLTNMFGRNRQSVAENTVKESVKWSKQLEGDILAIPARAGKMKQLLDSHIYGSRVFDFFQTNTLKAVKITSFEVKSPLAGQNTFGGSVGLTGEARDFESLAKQIVWLRHLSTVSNLTLTNVVRQDFGNITFDVSLDVSDAFFKPSSK